ncbi:MAG: hypothetical protein Q7K42_00080, partial [Candidatus Diapherotrites archaeon]|nr:hypothetical protein [Candidatus Diapherotrites archaeon]
DNGKVKIKRARTINFPKTFTQMICDAFSRNPKFVPNPIIVKRALLEYLLSNRSLQEIFFLNFEKTHELVGKIKNLSDNEVEKIFERINGIGRQYFKKDKYQENILNVVNGFFKRKKEREREMRRISAIPTISAKPAQAQVPVILTPKKPAKKPKLETVKPAIVPEKKSTNNRFMEKQKRRIVNECLKNGFSPDQALHYFEIVDGRLEYEEAFLKVDDYLDISEKLNSAGIALDAVRRSLISQYLLYPHKRQEVIGTIHNLANRIESREAESKTGEKDFDMRKIKLLLRKAGRTHPRKLVSAFIAIGFRLFRQGNHPIYAKGMKRISLPVKEDVGLGGILLFAKQAQLSNEELTSLVEFLTK